MIDYSKIPSPCYVLDEAAFRRNLELIRSVGDRAGVEIILAFKAFALWKVFPIVREYITCSTASSLCEARLALEERFGRFFPHIRWLNLGGGHLMTREGYDVEHLVCLLRDFRARHPHIQVILEPGSAFAWRAGVLVSTVQDVVENHGVRTAMLDVSFACHMPDCLEMPYKPSIVGATEPVAGQPTYRMGGNSCLAGDYCGDWSFDRELRPGDRIVFEDMMHYTTVKTTMFNGVTHPSIGLWTAGGDFRLLREFGYEDYKARMD